NDLPTLVRQTTHWHRLSSYGLEKDLLYCISEDVANVLPRYKNGELLVHG
ncbi:MAG: 2-phosphosulfolactate phosphatase, partial [Methylobacterium sp.]|nr:2-phosphosulfolactate phosphatase [Methylobacterium sp.]